jgi:AraC-like DNA-binding protein
MKLFVKNMVCDRCKMVVKTEFEKLGLDPIDVQLGTIIINKEVISTEVLSSLAVALEKHGFSLLTDKKEQLVAQLKAKIIEVVHYASSGLPVNLSLHLSESLGTNYSQLSAIFSELTETTIEQYYIQQKIERAKELLSYGDQSLSEIAYTLNYSSVAHLSAQFKKITGQTASAFRYEQNHIRRTLDEV